MAFDAKLIRQLGSEAAFQTGKLSPYCLGERNGRLAFSYDGGRPKNLDSLPFPAWDLLHEDADGNDILEIYLSTPIWGGDAKNSSATSFTVNRSLSTVSSRGCPFACKFCFRGAQGERNYGIRSAENLASELQVVSKKYDVDFVGIVDDNFMVNPARIKALAPVMGPVVEQHGLRWGTHGRLDEAADLRPGSKGKAPQSNSYLRVEGMSQAGCVYIGFGAESASPHVLDLMGKGGFMLSNGTVEMNGFTFSRAMVEGIRNTLRANIHPNCTWIMGYPGERLEDLKTSVAFIKWQQELVTEGLTPGSTEHAAALKSVNGAMFTATAYPGTDMFKDVHVKTQLSKNFGIAFDRDTGEPLLDQAMKTYVEELNDATKLLYDREGRPLNFSEMSNETFIEARALADNGQIERILDL